VKNETNLNRQNPSGELSHAVENNHNCRIETIHKPPSVKGFANTNITARNFKQALSAARTFTY